MIAHLKETMKPYVSFFDLLWPANKALPAWVVSISTDVATDITLSRVIPRATVDINLESHLHS